MQPHSILQLIESCAPSDIQNLFLGGLDQATRVNLSQLSKNWAELIKNTFFFNSEGIPDARLKTKFERYKKELKILEIKFDYCQNRIESLQDIIQRGKQEHQACEKDLSAGGCAFRIYRIIHHFLGPGLILNTYDRLIKKIFSPLVSRRKFIDYDKGVQLLRSISEQQIVIEKNEERLDQLSEKLRKIEAQRTGLSSAFRASRS
jgi:hypothetical protein